MEAIGETEDYKNISVLQVGFKITLHLILSPLKLVPRMDLLLNETEPAVFFLLLPAWHQDLRGPDTGTLRCVSSLPRGEGASDFVDALAVVFDLLFKASAARSGETGWLIMCLCLSTCLRLNHEL